MDNEIQGQGIQAKDELLLPTTPAAGTEGGAPGRFVPPPPGPTPLPGLPDPIDNTGDGAGSTATSDQPAGAPPPINFGEETAGAGAGKAPEEPAIRKWSKAEEDEAIGMFLNLRNMATTRIERIATGDPESSALELSEEEMQELGPHYRPLFKMYGGKIPWWVWLVGAELTIMGPKIYELRKTVKVNKENAKILAEGDIPQQKTAVQDLAPAGPNKTRRKFAIDAKGYYACTEKGDYLAKPLRKEKASLADIDKIVRDSARDLVRLAFPTVDLSAYPPEEE